MDSRRKQYLLVIFLILCVLTGSAYSIVQKFQNETRGKDGRRFDHPYF